MFFKSSDYESIPESSQQHSVTEKLLEQIDDGNSEQSEPRAFWNRYRVYWTNGISLLFCVLFFILWVNARKQASVPQIMPYSPANAAVEYLQELTLFNGSFEYPSIYRGRPNPELDAAWHNISDRVKLARLTREQLSKIGKEDSPSKVKYSERDGGGYVGALEVTHQLHCLNMIRKYLYYDYYGQTDPFFTDSNPESYKMHLDHCIDNLRQFVMCSASAEMITFEWVKGSDFPYPDFNVGHQCRNFEKLIDWQNSNGVHDVPYSHIVRLKGEVDLATPP